MKTYYVTFGQASLFRNNWLEIEADNEWDVRVWCNAELKRWAGVYSEDNFEPSYYPGGKIGETVKLYKELITT